MKGKRLDFTFLLMMGSILLLIILQVLWIRNLYENASADFTRDTNLVVRNTLVNLQNEQWRKNMVELPDDSIPPGAEMDSKRKPFDSLSHRRPYQAIKEEDQIFLGSENGSKKVTIRSRLSKFPVDSLNNHKPTRRYIIRMDTDSISPDTLRMRIAAKLQESGLDVPFAINPLKGGHHFNFPVTGPIVDFMGREKEFESVREEQRRKMKFNIFSDTIHSDTVRVTTFNSYGISFFNVRTFLLRQISPQIFFSVFLTAMIITAFSVMHRNLKSQQRLMETKNDFINNVTHELKTPVATVSVALEAIQNFNVSQDPRLTKEYLDIAQRELKRLNEITDRILRTSVLENEVAITKETTDLNGLIQKVIADLKLIIDQRNATVQYESTGTDFSLQCQPHRLYQMIQNLLENALKYSPDEPRIKIILIGSNSSLVLSIQDQGIGIQKEYQNKIFEKFFRVPTGNIHSIKGYGLGLSYVLNLVTLLGGQIKVESEINKGSSFTLTFPRTKGRDLSIKIGRP
jgi:two-component system, OmpR family, phosphate regulon sensor histidine kinase PhoR